MKKIIAIILLIIVIIAASPKKQPKGNVSFKEMQEIQAICKYEAIKETRQIIISGASYKYGKEIEDLLTEICMLKLGYYDNVLTEKEIEMNIEDKLKILTRKLVEAKVDKNLEKIMLTSEIIKSKSGK